MSNSPDMIQELSALLGTLSPKELNNIAAQANEAVKEKCFIPSPGPQTEAYFSEADILLYGGFPGAGKSALLNGLALNEHNRSLIVRRQFADLDGIVADCKKIARKLNPTLKGFVGGGRPKYRKPNGGEISFEGVETKGSIDAGKQGNPRDFIGVDEGAQLPLDAIMMLYGWNRSDIPGQRCRMVIASNPPVNSTGDWMADFFAPWLDPDHINPAKHGELRYFYMDEDGNSIPCDSKEPFVNEFGMKIFPHSRSFIPGTLKDNPFLGEEYMAKIQALPEPTRSILLSGNFLAMREDPQNQAIPTDWVKEAIERRETHKFPPAGVPMSNIGVDIAAGGKDNTVLATRYDWWFDDVIEVPGVDTPKGRDVAALIMSNMRDQCGVTLDMSGGFGSGVWECLVEAIDDKRIYTYKGAESAAAYRTRDGAYGFTNIRSAAYWKFREALDPSQNGGSPICLPNDKKLLSQLTAPTFEVTPRGIKLEPKEEVVKKLGYSPDRADAIVMCWYFGVQGISPEVSWKRQGRSHHRPKVNIGYSNRKKR